MTDFHLVEANLRQSFRVLAEGRPCADVLELPGVSIASVGVAFQMFNTAFLSAPVLTQAEFETTLERARLHFQLRRLAWALWLCEDWIDGSLRRNVTATCQRFGLRFSSEMPGMIATPPLLPVKRALPELKLRRVVCERTLGDFRGIGSVSFHVPYHWFSEVFDLTLPAERPEFACYVGYHHGEAVATSGSVRSQNVMGLYNIATAPSHRGRGFAQAITRQTIATPGEADLPAHVVLQSTSQGFRMYERLGFQTVTRIRVYNSM